MRTSILRHWTVCVYSLGISAIFSWSCPNLEQQFCIPASQKSESYHLYVSTNGPAHEDLDTYRICARATLTFLFIE